MKPSYLVIILDFLILNILLYVFHIAGWDSGTTHWWLMANLFFSLSVFVLPPFAHTNFVRVEQILSRVIQTVTLMYVLVGLYIWLDDVERLDIWGLSLEYLFTMIAIFYNRYLCKEGFKRYRAHSKNNHRVIFVGAGVNMVYLYKVMNAELSNGYRVLGYFDDHISTHLPPEVQRFGDITNVLPWLQQNNVHQIYCNLPNSRAADITAIIDYCEKHFIRFFSVPNVHNYVHRSMVVQMIDDMPVLTLRREPMQLWHNRFIKRVFDILVSGIFLITCFWWITILVALITKITMPGPLFFRQKRNGYRGREFYCLKFRSMRVNADADRLQATKNDPRKTPWGNIMRKTNIDELPQFLNVFLGDMSVVGPRPHMVKHTQEYSALIDKYMVRHWVKPGVTGWAQTHGARGETEHLWQMEDRIVKDVWYIENWSLWLDLRIIYLTVRNVIFGDKQAY